MNKFVFLVVLTFGVGVGGAALRGPMVPLLIYYLYAVLRPQFLWKWHLNQFPELGWSFYTAVAAIIAYPFWNVGTFGSRNDPERRIHPPFTWAHQAMLLFFVWTTISYLTAEDQGRAWEYYWELCKVMMMYLLASQVVRSLWQVWYLYLTITGAMAYIAFDLLDVYLTTGYLVLFKRGYAGLDNNGAALMLAMGIPLCYFAWEATRGWYRWGFLLAIPAIAEVVMSSYSRGAMLSALFCAPLYLVYSRRRRFLLACYAAAAVGVPVVAGEEIKRRFFSVSEAKTGEDDSFNLRLMSWKAAALIANDYPVFGCGVRCSNNIIKWYGADMEGRTVHSLYLQFAADIGWLGLFWYLVAVGLTFLAIWRARRRLWAVRTPEADRAVAMLGGIECALITFLIGASALSLETFELPYLLLFLGAQVWAICNAQVSPPPGTPRAFAPPNQVPVGRPRLATAEPVAPGRGGAL